MSARGDENGGQTSTPASSSHRTPNTGPSGHAVPSGPSGSQGVHLTPRASGGSQSGTPLTPRSTPGSYHRSDLGTHRQRRLHRPGGGAGPSAVASATPSSSSGGVPEARGGGRERGRPGVAIPTSTPSDTPLHSLNAHGRPPANGIPSAPNSEGDGHQGNGQQHHQQQQRGAGGGAAGGLGSMFGNLGGEDGDGDGEETFVWGTAVSVREVSRKFKSFLHSFRAGEDDVEGKYMTQMDEVLERESDTFLIDCHDVHSHDAELYRLLVRYPLEVIPIFDIVIADMAAEKDPTRDLQIQVRTFNLKDTVHMRHLNPSDIDALVSVRGMVIRTSSLIPDIKAAFFRCLVCGHSPDLVLVDRGRIEEPTRCPRPECAARNSMVLLHNRSKFTNKQMVRLQESPEDIPEGETPHAVSVCVFDTLVDYARPGDRVEITGVFRAIPVRVVSTHRNLRSLYKTYIDCIHIRKQEGGRFSSRQSSSLPPSHSHSPDLQDEADANNADTPYFTPQQIARFRELASQPDIYDRLTRSIAPSIYELDDIKRGLLAQLFGGSIKRLSGGAQFRGDVNVLLVGDPGTSKSQLLQYVHKIAPRGIYTSGRGSSAVGLTAYVTKDPETKEMVLESGALVLSDRGICCIDEFDKMSDSARSMLHEVMEQQTVSVAKAGIIATLNARTSVLACANPVGSRYNPRMSVIDNIQLPPTLLSRFDLIYLVLDKADEVSDRRLAKHLVALHFEEQPESSSPSSSIDLPTLASFIAFARAHVKPQLSEEAAEELVNVYVELRGRGVGRKVITATPRQLESLIRLSEALARMRLAETVELTDVTEARRLLEVAMQQSATDPTTGTIDMDLITTGVSASERSRRLQIQAAVLSLLQDKAAAGRNTIKAAQVWEDMKQQSSLPVSLQEIRDSLTKLQGEGHISFLNDVARML